MRKITYLIVLIGFIIVSTLSYPYLADKAANNKPKWFRYPINSIIHEELGFRESSSQMMYTGPIWYTRFSFNGSKTDFINHFDPIFENIGCLVGYEEFKSVSSIPKNRHFKIYPNSESFTYNTPSSFFFFIITEVDGGLEIQGTYKTSL